LKKRLRARGFDESYRVVGNPERQLSEINDALPPPVAQAFARTLYNHIHGLVKRAKAIEESVKSQHRGAKRKAQEDLEEALNKRVRSDMA